MTAETPRVPHSASIGRPAVSRRRPSRALPPSNAGVEVAAGADTSTPSSKASQPGALGTGGTGPVTVGRVAADPQPRSLVHGEHRAVVLLEELVDPLLAGLAHERRGRIGVDVVQVDLERHQAERVEASAGWQIGMSLVVRMVGQATLVPADAPMYRRRPARTRSPSPSTTSRPYSESSSRKVLPPPIITTSASRMARSGASDRWADTTSMPNAPSAAVTRSA